MNVLLAAGHVTGCSAVLDSGGGEAGKVPTGEEGPWGLQLFGFGRNQPHQHLLLGSGMRRAEQEGQGGLHALLGTWRSSPRWEQRLWSSAWSVPTCAGSEQAL